MSDISEREEDQRRDEALAEAEYRDDVLYAQIDQLIDECNKRELASRLTSFFQDKIRKNDEGHGKTIAKLTTQLEDAYRSAFKVRDTLDVALAVMTLQRLAPTSLHPGYAKGWLLQGHVETARKDIEEALKEALPF